ncbi:MAG: error-prone DNA polymerase [Deltaproteobacteria bacterium]|nr:error-prone DNA polymerase [Deltaproteobacteria bacterium]
MRQPGCEGYVELRCRSAFSFLEGASNPEDLALCAAELGYDALALADRDGLYGAPRFYRAACAAGLRAIVGADLGLAGGGRLLLLAESQAGYRNLSRLVTLARRDAPRGAPAAAWPALEEHAGGLVGLLRGDASLDSSLLSRAHGILGSRLWIDVSRHLDRSAETAARRAVALAEAARVPIVATNDARCARPADRRLLDAFTCLRHGTSLDRAGRALLPNAERCLHAPREMAERFSDRPAWLRATREIADRCAFTMHDLGYSFPTFPTPAGETQISWLRRETFAGAALRYGMPLSRRVRAQIEHELAVIEKLGLAGYFLIVHDIVCFAQREGILVQGRGSAANSAVCYALGITAIDPVGMELLFERFLSEERGEWPDIDLDLPSGEERERVIQYVLARYGPHGAAMTANVITYRTKLAVREMGKVLGLAPDAIDRLAKLLGSFELDLRPPPDGPGPAPHVAPSPERAQERDALLRRAGVDPQAPRIATLLALVERARGLPRHLGQHSGGVVIAAGRLDEVVPIEPAAMPGRRVVQWDKDDCADLGIIKIDLLGLGMLSVLERTLPLVRDHEGIELDLAKLPQDDPATYAMIQRADTMGVFQIESRAQMATLPRMKPERFYDLVVEVAIIRPGPIVGRMVHPYLARRAGREPVTVPHPSLAPILARTLGVPLFQEQLLRIAMTVAGFTGGEAEELRRAMGMKRSAARMAAIERKLRDGMRERGIEGEAQEEIVRGITSFALYGFPESHAASFALLAYASAYLKAHHPAAFLAGLLNAWPMGFYSPASLVKDAQRHGVEVRPIDVARSAWECTLEAASAGHAPAVRIGLRFVSGLREEAGRTLEAERTRASFASAADLARRVALRRAELDALAALGALASLETPAPTRRAALWQVAALERDAASLFAGTTPETGPSPLGEMTPLEETLADYRESGITTGPQILAHLRPRLAARGVVTAEALCRIPNGRSVRLAGHVIVRQRPVAAKGFCFLTLEDETGTANAVLTPDALRRFRATLQTSPLVEIEGPLQNLEGVIHLRVRSLAPL